MKPKLISGSCFSDNRGALFYNNDFDFSKIKKMYVTENADTNIIRGWQGHEIEKRWFCAINGSFEIKVIKIDDWLNPSAKLGVTTHIISSEKLDILYVPAGFATSIQSLEVNAKLLVMANYFQGEINDEHRYELDFFKV